MDTERELVRMVHWTFRTKKDSEKAEILWKVEPYLTSQLERQGADIQSKVEELELLNQHHLKKDDFAHTLIEI
jgi:hypothetical protein